MKPAEKNMRIATHLAGRLGPLTLAIGLLISLVAPTTYYLIENRALRNTATQNAQHLSQQFRDIVLENPKLWKYQAQKYLEVLHAFLPNKGIDAIRIVDASGITITDYNYRHTDTEPSWWHHITRHGTAPIIFNNQVLGIIRVDISAYPVLVRSLYFFLPSACAGVGIALFAYLFPVTVVRRLEKRVQDLLSALRNSHHDLAAIVQERTVDLRKTNTELEQEILERKKFETALKESQSQLEQRVATRTADLLAANHRLKLEIKNRVRVEEALRASEERLHYLSSKLLIVQEEERKRVAMEIHDSLATTLSAIKFSVETTRRDFQRGVATVKPLTSLIATIQLAIDECRRIMSGLHPSSLDELGVVATIDWFCADYRLRYSKIDVQMKIDLNENDIPHPIKVVIFRLTQEAFHNVSSHSRATRATLSLKKSDGAIEFTVADNGRGFDVNAGSLNPPPMKGLGILSMQERTENIGGTFVIESARSKGTMIRARWPISKDIAKKVHAA